MSSSANVQQRRAATEAPAPNPAPVASLSSVQMAPEKATTAPDRRQTQRRQPPPGLFFNSTTEKATVVPRG